jgi:hypothetical protein
MTIQYGTCVVLETWKACRGSLVRGRFLRSVWMQTGGLSSMYAEQLTHCVEKQEEDLTLL